MLFFNPKFKITAVQRYKCMMLAMGESATIKKTPAPTILETCHYVKWGIYSLGTLQFNFSEGIKIIMRRYINVI